MKDEARERFAKGVLGARLDRAAAAAVNVTLESADKQFEDAVNAGGTVAEREARLDVAKQRLSRALPIELDASARQAAGVLIEDLANLKMVTTAGADRRQQQSVARAIERLMDSLPNNPRRIKRIFMAFATYEAVGRAYFGYRLTPHGADGELRARRWRQLAMWVALATEWPETWRAIARQPLLTDLAFGSSEAKAEAEKIVRSSFDNAAGLELQAILRVLVSRDEIMSLLAAREQQSDEFSRTCLESDAVYEFNRIIWEPGFSMRRTRVNRTSTPAIAETG